MRKRRGSATGVLAVVLLVGVTAGCAAEPPPSKPPADERPGVVAQPAATPGDGCPVLAPVTEGATASAVAIDYVDFIDHDGRQYLAGSTAVGPISHADLGDVVLRSTCSFSAVNDRTGREPGPAGDGDTAFLPPGTAIYAVRGWAPECRLAAERDGRIRVYVALDPNAQHARPARCTPA